MRLDQAVSKALRVSRKQARQLIIGGEVQAAGQTVTDPGLHIAADTLLSRAGAPLAQPAARYYMLNKPAGYVCTHSDTHHPSVFDLLPGQRELQVAGRLDADTLGLVLLTDDGQWNHRVTSPRRQCLKRYRVTTSAPLAEAGLRAMAEGLLLHGETRPTRPARLEPRIPTEFDLWISEGRYHQVKRMVAAVGGRVTGLKRLAIGPIELDPNLAAGDWRPLTPAEIATFTP